nr:hypothetical protein [uncultured bacterium]
MRIWIVALIATAVGCSNRLSGAECMQLLQKEVAFFKEHSPKTPERMRSLGEAMQNCPTRRTRQDFECVMAAKNQQEFLACNL